MYFFTQSAIDKDFRLTKKDFLHFIPFMVILGFIQINFQPTTTEEKQEIVAQFFEKPPLPIIVGTVVIFGVIGVYLFFSFRKMKEYDQRISLQYANIDRMNVNWIREVLLSFMGILGISLLTNIVRYYFPDFWTAMGMLNLSVLLFVGSRLLFKFADYQPVN